MFENFKSFGQKIRFRKAQKLLRKGDFEKALMLFRASVDAESNSENLFHLALCLMGLAVYDEAEKYLDQIKAEYSENELTTLAMAECYLMQKKWDLAVNEFRQLTEINPEHQKYNSYYQLAADPVKREKYQLSKILMNKAIMEIQKKKYSEAKDLLLEADALSGKNPIILNNLGSIFLIQKDYKNAYKYFSLALEFDRNNKKIIQNIIKTRRKIKASD